MSIIEERQRQRWKMLHKYWELTGGHGDNKIINMWNVGEQLGWDREVTHATFDYLKGEGLLISRALGGGSTITHWGVKEVEETLQGRATEHFQPNIVLVSGGTIGNIAVGNQNTITQTAFPSFLDAANDLERRLRELSDELPEPALKLIEEARRDEPNRIVLAQAASDTAAIGESWTAKLKEFALQAASGGAGGLLVEAVKFALGL